MFQKPASAVCTVKLVWKVIINYNVNVSMNSEMSDSTGVTVQCFCRAAANRKKWNEATVLSEFKNIISKIGHGNHIVFATEVEHYLSA